MSQEIPALPQHEADQALAHFRDAGQGPEYVRGSRDTYQLLSITFGSDGIPGVPPEAWPALAAFFADAALITHQALTALEATS